MSPNMEMVFQQGCNLVPASLDIVHFVHVTATGVTLQLLAETDLRTL